MLQLSKDENGSNEVAITYSMDNLEDERDVEQCFGIDFGDEHSADPMRDSYSYHLICGSKECVVISLHNHPSLSKISLVDVRFFLEHLAIKLLIVVTNMGNIYYLVKTNKFDRQKAIILFNEAVSVNNKARGSKALQKASEYFLKSCHKAGIVYEDRKEVQIMKYNHAVLGESIELYNEAVEWGRDQKKRMEKNEKARVIILDSLIHMLAEKRKIIESRQSNK